MRDRVLEKETNFKFIILATVMVIGENDLAALVGSEIRILLLYCSREEARMILQIANKLGLTGMSQALYIRWIKLKLLSVNPQVPIMSG